MKTVKCQHCGQEIPENAIVCPNCSERCLSTKNKILAAIFAIILGPLGIHNFYLSYTTRGWIELGCSALGALLLLKGFVDASTALLVVGIVIMALVWVSAIVQGILYLTRTIGRDGKGKRLA
ncbi:MAG: TM2 domain-containing protein [Clostridia bacterium]|nr:TM2 domain-containing protein [Clostridia bacterium]